MDLMTDDFGTSFALHPPSADLLRFVEEAGADDPVVVVGGRTHWAVGGAPDPEARLIRAPIGVTELLPSELIVRCGAGTPVRELDAALATVGLMCPIDPQSQDTTVGGALCVGQSGHRRLRYGPIRDLLLEARYVTASGHLSRAGAPVVKNVTGYDICRLLVGSLGTIGLLGEVVLRCRPRPAVAAWLTSSSADPFAVRHQLFAPSSILWDGAQTWVLLEGSPAEVEAERRSLGTGWTESSQPSFPPFRESLQPKAIRTYTNDSGWIAEIGVGTIHSSRHIGAAERPPVSKPVAELNTTLKARFDPTGRLNPGRSVVRP